MNLAGMKVGLLLLATVLAGNHASDMLAVAAPPQQPGTQNIAIYVKDMHCAGCAKTISSKLYTVKGVAKVSTNLSKHLAVVVPSKSGNPSLKGLWEAVEAVKFQPVKLIADQKVYTKKPAK